jgi:hypothetical protein
MHPDVPALQIRSGFACGIDDLNSLGDINIYPNPVTGNSIMGQIPDLYILCIDGKQIINVRMERGAQSGTIKVDSTKITSSSIYSEMLHCKRQRHCKKAVGEITTKPN